MPNAKAMAPGSTNMHPQVEGGEPRRVSKGDLKYLIFRPDPELRIPLE